MLGRTSCDMPAASEAMLDFARRRERLDRSNIESICEVLRRVCTELTLVTSNVADKLLLLLT